MSNAVVLVPRDFRTEQRAREWWARMVMESTVMLGKIERIGEVWRVTISQRGTVIDPEMN